MSGVERIAKAFEAARSEGRSALMPYFTLGFPDPHTSLEVVAAVAEAGADLIELGVPFSDPLADGPTIQRSTQTALAQGMSVRKCLDLTRSLRARGVSTPVLLMGYVNPILAYGIERFAADAAEAGADGLIVPDLPVEEAAPLEAACRRQGLALVYLVSPASTDERIRLVAEHSQGFLYLVSVLGVTGAREALSGGLEAFIQRVRRFTQQPLAVGFGISNAEQAAQIGRCADGVIVGSALIAAVENAADPVRAGSDFVRGLRQALEKSYSFH
jgi:tryptophan synthase alpha chain